MAGGGGGNTTTTTAAIDPDIKKRVLPVLEDVTARYGEEQAGNVPVLAGSQGVNKALDVQDQLAQGVLSEGLGTDKLLNALDETRGKQLAAGQTTLGSARADRARQAGLTDRALQLQQADLSAREAAAKGLTATAEGRRALRQQEIDAPHTSAQRYFGYLGSAPQGQTTTQSGGGGGK